MKAMRETAENAVRIVEVGPRDGLQNIKTHIATETKVELIQRLQETGLRTIELTSIVSAKAVPQLSDCRNLLLTKSVQDLQQDETLRLPVLTPNMKGLQIAIEHGVKEVAVFISASEGFSKANINCSVAEGLDRARKVCSRAASENIAVRGYVSCIFSDPFDGPTPRENVIRVVQDLLQMECYEVSLGDTLGEGTALDVQNLLSSMSESGINMHRLAGHFHDTYGQAVSNVWAAYQCGMRVFDSSVAGLGGCPYCPGAKGNVATEDLIYLFNQAGVETGVDMEKLVQVGHWISTLLGIPNGSRAGSAFAAKLALDDGSTQKEGEKNVRSVESERTQNVGIGLLQLSLGFSTLWQVLETFWKNRHQLWTPLKL